MADLEHLQGRLRGLVATLVGALALAGCGLTGSSPVVSTEAEVVDAILALQAGARTRGTAELTVDQDELRDVLRDDPAALELLRDLADSEGVQDADELLAELEDAQARLARQAVLLEVGADRSARVAAEQDGTVWADVRVGTDASDGQDLADGARVDLQAQVDWAVAAEVFDEPAMLDQLDGAIALVRDLAGGVPELDAVAELAVGFLAGELVGIGGELTPDLLAPFGRGSAPLGSDGPLGALADLTPRQLLTTGFTFDGFRTDGDDTLVDVTVEVAALGELVLDALAEDPGASGMTFAEVEDARVELADLPERLDRAATLRLDAAGDVSEVRIDLLDIALQTSRSASLADDEAADLATALRVAEQLDDTGFFLVLAVSDVGEVASVLGDPATSVTPRQLADAAGALLRGALGGFAGPGGDPHAALED